MYNVAFLEEEIKESLPSTLAELTLRFTNTEFYRYCTQKEDALFHFQETLDKYVQRHLDNFHPPEDADDFYDAGLAFRTSFVKNMLRYVIYDVTRIMKRIRLATVSLEDLDESQLATEDDMSDRVHKQIMQEKMETLNRVFEEYCNTLEKKMLYAMLHELPWKALIAHVGPTQSGELLTIQEAGHVRNVLEYRLTCWYAVNKFPNPEETVKALNKHPNLNKRFFGCEKLEALPDMVIMKRVAKGNTKRPEKRDRLKPMRSLEEVRQQAVKVFGKIRENSGDKRMWAFCSPWYKGIKHDSPKVFINKSGYAYSHIDRKVWDIFAPDAA